MFQDRTRESETVPEKPTTGDLKRKKAISVDGNKPDQVDPEVMQSCRCTDMSCFLVHGENFPDGGSIRPDILCFPNRGMSQTRRTRSSRQVGRWVWGHLLTPMGRPAGYS